MNKAIKETLRRREAQIAYNIKNNITPTALNKPIVDIIDGVYKTAQKSHFEIKLPKNMSNKEILKTIKQTEKQMKAHVENLEFEKAAICRDEIKLLKELLLKDGVL